MMKSTGCEWHKQWNTGTGKAGDDCLEWYCPGYYCQKGHYMKV